jgi:menaquinone-dependent protoporphyrinogen IX oxidase
VNVLPVDSVKDVKPYHAIVLGSAVYAGMWLKKAAVFLEANERSWQSGRCGFFPAALRERVIRWI